MRAIIGVLIFMPFLGGMCYSGTNELSDIEASKKIEAAMTNVIHHLEREGDALIARVQEERKKEIQLIRNDNSLDPKFKSALLDRMEHDNWPERLSKKELIEHVRMFLSGKKYHLAPAARYGIQQLAWVKPQLSNLITIDRGVLAKTSSIETESLLFHELIHTRQYDAQKTWRESRILESLPASTKNMNATTISKYRKNILSAAAIHAQVEVEAYYFQLAYHSVLSHGNLKDHFDSLASNTKLKELMGMYKRAIDIRSEWSHIRLSQMLAWQKNRPNINLAQVAQTEGVNLGYNQETWNWCKLWLLDPAYYDPDLDDQGFVKSGLIK